jgi:hypothetical protein
MSWIDVESLVTQTRPSPIGASQFMGGYGSGRSGRGPTVESAFRIDIDALPRHGLIRLGAHGGCVIRFSGHN